MSLFTVKEEMGHASLKMIEEVYGHLDDLRYRSPVVEYILQAEWQARVLTEKR